MTDDVNLERLRRRERKLCESRAVTATHGGADFSSALDFGECWRRRVGTNFPAFSLTSSLSACHTLVMRFGLI